MKEVILVSVMLLLAALAVPVFAQKEGAVTVERQGIVSALFSLPASLVNLFFQLIYLIVGAIGSSITGIGSSLVGGASGLGGGLLNVVSVFVRYLIGIPRAFLQGL